MEYIYPDYYHDFVCKAGQCEDTCCAGWAIEVDEASLDKYDKLSTSFGNRLRGSIDYEKGTFLQCNHRCAFLNDDNLCDMIVEAGEDYLCYTCRTFPRHMEEFEGRREWTLSLACPVVAKLLLNRQEKVTFLSEERDEDEEEFEFFDYFLDTKLQECKERFLSILTNRNQSTEKRFQEVCAIAKKVQDAIDRNALFEIDGILSENLSPEDREEIKWDDDTLFGLWERCENLNPSWPEYVTSARQAKIVNHKLSEIQKEQLGVYFLSTYLTGAVYDDDLISKVLMCVYSVQMIERLCGDGRDPVRAAYGFSKEIEHSDFNIERIFEYMDEIGGAL